jgi:hypothetical protein
VHHRLAYRLDRRRGAAAPATSPNSGHSSLNPTPPGGEGRGSWQATGGGETHMPRLGLLWVWPTRSKIRAKMGLLQRKISTMVFLFLNKFRSIQFSATNLVLGPHPNIVFLILKIDKVTTSASLSRVTSPTTKSILLPSHFNRTSEVRRFSQNK